MFFSVGGARHGSEVLSYGMAEQLTLASDVLNKYLPSFKPVATVTLSFKLGLAKASCQLEFRCLFLRLLLLRLATSRQSPCDEELNWRLLW